MNSITASMARAYSEGVALSQNNYNGDPREAPYVPEPKYFDKLPGIFAKAKGKTLNEQADAVTEAIAAALDTKSSTARVQFRLDPILILQLAEQNVTAQVDGTRTIMNW